MKCYTVNEGAIVEGIELGIGYDRYHGGEPFLGVVLGPGLTVPAQLPDEPPEILRSAFPVYEAPLHFLLHPAHPDVRKVKDLGQDDEWNLLLVDSAVVTGAPVKGDRAIAAPDGRPVRSCSALFDHRFDARGRRKDVFLSLHGAHTCETRLVQLRRGHHAVVLERDPDTAEQAKVATIYVGAKGPVVQTEQNSVAALLNRRVHGGKMNHRQARAHALAMAAELRASLEERTKSK